MPTSIRAANGTRSRCEVDFFRNRLTGCAVGAVGALARPWARPGAAELAAQMRARQPAQLADVMDGDFVDLADRHDAAPLEAGERARDGLDRQSEIVGDAIARHREADVGAILGARRAA